MPGRQCHPRAFPPSPLRRPPSPSPPSSFLSLPTSDLAALLPRLLQMGASMAGPLAHLHAGKVRGSARWELSAPHRRETRLGDVRRASQSEER